MGDPVKALTGKTYNEALALWDEGSTLSRIARELGVGRFAVRRALKRRNAGKPSALPAAGSFRSISSVITMLVLAFVLRLSEVGRVLQHSDVFQEVRGRNSTIAERSRH